MLLEKSVTEEPVPLRSISLTRKLQILIQHSTLTQGTTTDTPLDELLGKADESSGVYDDLDLADLI